MLVGYMHLLVAEFRDDDEDIGLLYLCLGYHLYQQALKAKRHNRAGRRYGTRGPYIKNCTQEFVDGLINRATDQFFKNWFCVGRTSFASLLKLIEDNPIFTNPCGFRPQAPVKYQLAVYLVHYRNVQNVKSAMLLQMSEGSMYNYCRRVIWAFCQLRNRFIRWPNPEERRLIKLKAQRFGFLGAERNSLQDQEMHMGVEYPGCG
ncbi:hypothetical protein FRC08_018261 [Ceratobasidium sp. 394]|nr:hypothetical protein FRC08_018261 [Ceratobasidium sp. 394]